MFWINYFVYQRGEERSRRDEWLKTIQELVPAWNDAWTDIWHIVHNSLLKELVGKFEEYMEKWLESPAGIGLMDDLRNAMYHFMIMKF